MKVTLSLQRFKKIKTLSETEFGMLCEVIRSGGVVEVSEEEIESFSGLRSKGFIKAKSGRAWVNFEVNGVKPSPFVGARARKDRSVLDNRKVAAIFAKEYEKATGGKYGVYTKSEWALLTKLSKDFDLFELEMMLQEFFITNKSTEPNLFQFFKRKNSLYRAVAGRVQGAELSERGAASSRGWESVPEIHTRRSPKKIPRSKS